MRLLLLSTYELGHQPLGIAVPASALRAAGHETASVDLAKDELPGSALSWAEAVAISVPMHTATTLAVRAMGAIRRQRPDLPVAWHGLYAPVLEGHEAVRPGDLLVAGDATVALLEWVAGLTKAGPANTGQTEGLATGVRVQLGPARSKTSLVPWRWDLPPLDGYARLERGGRSTLTASVAASVGCNHTCRHCPVAAVYRGRSRPVEVSAVLADIAQVTGAGAGHVSFADPDFLNRPRHALEVARALHARHPELTFDATVKVEHILRHRHVWPELSRCGLIFVTSAFESVDDRTLQLLAKGHRAEDEEVALGVVRSEGIELRPSWLPFTPWTTFASVAALLEFVATHDLVFSTDAVQYSIRLLLPRGSLLLERPDPWLERGLGQETAGSTTWVSADPALDELQLAVAARAEAGEGEPPEATFAAIWELARAAGAPLAAEAPAPTTPWLAPGDRPRLSESWFCCAEPTGAQLARLGAPR